jgi:hypothetical protein
VRVPVLALVRALVRETNLTIRIARRFPDTVEDATAMGCDAGGAVDLGIRTLTKL